MPLTGLADDRKVLVVGANGRVITARTHYRLLGLKGTIGENGEPLISGRPWNSPQGLELVRQAAGPDARVIFCEGVERFDILPLLVAT